MELRFCGEKKRFAKGISSSVGGNMDTENVNIHQVERAISIILGGMLILRSIRRLSLRGAALAGVLLYRGVSGHSHLYQVFGMNTATGRWRGTGASKGAVEVVRSITIGKPAHELYQLWRDPQTLSQIMGGLADVTQVSGNRQHWVLHGPFEKDIEWDAQVMEDQPDRRLTWKSLEGAMSPNEGVLSLKPAPRDWGTEVHLRFRFDPPGGTAGNMIARRLNIVTRLLAAKALRRFKSLAETGEIPTLKHTPAVRPMRSDAYVHA
jgi:uncharacterized membrane protein